MPPHPQPPQPRHQVSDNTVNRIGDVAKAMGEAFGVESWACDLFAEEVVRGGPAFAVSLLISSIEPHLRNAAALGSWQVGTLVVVLTLDWSCLAQLSWCGVPWPA
jgi:hypothetical protein